MRMFPLLCILAIISLDLINSLQVPARDVKLILTQNKALCISSDTSQNAVVVAACEGSNALSMLNDGVGFQMRFKDSMKCVQRDAANVVLSPCQDVPEQVWQQTDTSDEDTFLFQGKDTTSCLVSQGVRGNRVALASCNASDPKQGFEIGFE